MHKLLGCLYTTVQFQIVLSTLVAFKLKISNGDLAIKTEEGFSTDK